jgi:hypothetical protein
MCCQFLPTGGSNVPGYVQPLLFIEKSQNCQYLNNHRGKRKNKTRFRILKIIFLDECLTKFKNNLIILNKISHRFILTLKLFTEPNNLLKPLVISSQNTLQLESFIHNEILQDS